MRNFVAGIRNQWESLAPSKRLAFVVIVLGVLGTLGLWTFLGSQVPYEVAFDHVKSADASPVVDKLRELQIPYQLTGEMDGTTTIRVPVSQVDEARVRVAGAGLLQGTGIGYEIFNQPSFGLSDFIQQVDYQRALEGELARSIGQMDVVNTVRVHLAIPQPSVFLSEQRSPSAAIMVGLKPGRQIDRAQSKAIIDLVVGAVQGMKPAQVVLLDTQGQLFHQSGSGVSPAGNDQGAVDDQFVTQRTLERGLEVRLQDMLDRVVGSGHSSVQVTLGMDWTQGDLTTDTFLPNGQQPALLTSQDVHDVQPAGASAGGLAGIVSNVPTYQQGAPSTQVTTTNTITSTKATSEHTEASRTYQLSHTVEKSQRGPGAVKKVSVAIAVDQAAASADVVTQLTQMAQAAVGYDEKRGDTVSVVAIPMKIEVIATPVPQNTIIRQLSPYLDIARIAAMAIGPLLAVIVLALLLRRRRPYQSAVVARVGQPPLIEVATTPLVTPLADPGSTSMAPAVRRAFLRDQVTALAETHPALVASVLQVWVNEDAEARA